MFWSELPQVSAWNTSVAKILQSFERDRPSKAKLRAVLLLMGVTAIVSQIVLMRETLVIFYGNEISLGLFLASWLLWTAAGSFLIGRISPRLGHPEMVMAGLQSAIALTLPLTILAVRSSRGVFITVPGEILGPAPTLLTAVALLGPFCFVAGGMFSAGSSLLQQQTASEPAMATGSVYLLEAAGSGIGGLIASLMLVTRFASFQIVLLLGLLNLLAAVTLVFPTGRKRWLAVVVIAGIFLAGVLPFGGPALESLSLARLWRGFHLLSSQNSPYGNLAIVQTETNRTLLENGLPLFTDPDPETAEETVHYALLEHPAPRTVLLIGGGLNGSVLEALKYSSVERIDFVELDPEIFELGERYFADEMTALENQSRVRIHAIDGRLFLKGTREQFDVIIVNLPQPQTAQLNRFYTVDFFREAAAKLNPAGILSFQLPGSENYVTPATAAFLSCIKRSLHNVFPDVATIPGDTVHFFAARESGSLTRSPDELLQRLRSRHVNTSYIREYYVPFRMSPDRMQELEEQIQPGRGTPVNRDFAPVAYYFDVALWSTQFNQGYRKLFAGLADIRFRWIMAGLIVLMIGALALVVRGRRKPPVTSLATCVGSMGLTVMALEVLLLLGFQAIYGYVYQQLAVVIAAVMMGMALGSWLGLRKLKSQRAADIGWRHLSGIQVIAALSPLLLCGFLFASSTITSHMGLMVVSYLVFPAVALLCGLLGGYQFPIASHVLCVAAKAYGQNSGLVYAIDLAGACLGAVLLSAYLVPIYGFLKTSALISVLNVAAAALAIIAAWRARKPRGRLDQAASH
jgi:spermidine synthase